nr:hypothetical protein [uncultured Flavobacterium sp.]
MNYSIEFFRLLAVILITLTHTRNEFSSGTLFFIFEELPQIGTVLLSLISGYLYFKFSRKKENFYKTKVKNLLIPYLIANLSILFLVLIANYFLNINLLNRLTYDHTLITEGILSLNSPPINPPTYFIRDLFMIFTILEIIKNKNIYLLLLLIPMLFIGKLFLRLDIVVLFTSGMVIAYFSDWIKLNRNIIYLILIPATIIFAYFYSANISFIKYPISLLIFILLLNNKIMFYNVGAFTYLLHLYHSPIIVVLHPIISKLTKNNVLNPILQVILSIFFVYVLYLLTRKITFLKILTGQK